MQTPPLTLHRDNDISSTKQAKYNLTMKLTQALDSFSAKDSMTVGGKGAALGELIAVGFPVPRGFIITSATFERFLKDAGIGFEIDAILNTVDRDKMNTVEAASKRIESLILVAEMQLEVSNAIQHSFQTLGAEFVAVRSSATVEDDKAAAWAGQLESYLNTDVSSLLTNVKKCWASLYSPRAIFYRLEQDMKDQSVSVALVVQEMIDSDVAGVAFSVHPVTEDKVQILIEAGKGISPEEYQAKKAKLLNEKADIDQEIRDFEQKGNNWLEPMREVILLSSQAKILLSQGDKTQIRAFLKNVGSNFMLNPNRLNVSPKTGWRARLAGEPMTSFPNWRWVQDSNLRGHFCPNGFQDRRFRPLSQPTFRMPVSYSTDAKRKARQWPGAYHGFIGNYFSIFPKGTAFPKASHPL